MWMIFELLLRLYPREHRVEFGEDMRGVLREIVGGRETGLARARMVGTEMLGRGCGAASERFCELAGRMEAPMVAGIVSACVIHVLMYRELVPVRARSFSRLLELFGQCVATALLLGGVVYGQQQAKEDAEILSTVKSIYLANLVALREAKTLEDMKKLADGMDAPEWVSVDRFGRTVMTRRDVDRELGSMLSIPGDRRVMGLEVIWAERAGDRMIVVGWMMPNEIQRVDTSGEYGEKGATHRLMRGTLYKDFFVETPKGWRRVRHEKLLPNDVVLAVDGVARIVPPMAPARRIAPPK